MLQRNYGAADGKDYKVAGRGVDLSTGQEVLILEEMDEALRAGFARKVLGWTAMMLFWSVALIIGTKT